MNFNNVGVTFEAYRVRGKLLLAKEGPSAANYFGS